MKNSEEILRLLMELTKAFTRQMPLDLLLKQITDSTLEMMPGSHVSMRIIDDQRTELVCSARSGEGTSAPPMTFRKGEGVIGWVADYAKPVNIADTTNDSRFKTCRNQGFSIKSIAAVPVHVGDRVIGVLSVSSAETEAFTRDDIALLQLMANCSVPVIERARLERLSPYDELTLALKDSESLPRLEDDMLRARQSDTPLSLMVIALDDLEHVYRDHDFETGNRLLRKFADRIRELSHSTHKLIRRGADTFVGILPDTSGAMAMQHAEMLRMNLCDYPIHIGANLVFEQNVTVAVSSHKGDESPAGWLLRTEAVAEQAREDGGNTVVWAGRPIPRS